MRREKEIDLEKFYKIFYSEYYLNIHRNMKVLSKHTIE